jgi:hypothetical protein
MAVYDGSATFKSQMENGKLCSSCDDDDIDIIELKVCPSTIEGAGDGLFLSSEWVLEGQILLEEEAIAIKRSQAKTILKDPHWTHANPVIQCNSNRYLDIRKLLLYKANHCESQSRNCNVRVQQVGLNKLQMVALRDIDENEELMWEYSPTWYPPGH